MRALFVLSIKQYSAPRLVPSRYLCFLGVREGWRLGLFLPCPQSSPVKPGAQTQRYLWSVNPDWQVDALWHGLTSQALFQETNKR